MPKFKAFLKDTNQVLDVGIIFFELGIVKLTNNEFYEFEDIILMQTTGLHDSTKLEDLSEEEQEEWLESGKTADEWQGREIFEGDILTSQDGTDGLISRFIVKRDEFYTGFTPMNREGYGFNRTMCEVIGNAHQHHELLEDV